MFDSLESVAELEEPSLAPQCLSVTQWIPAIFRSAWIRSAWPARSIWIRSTATKLQCDSKPKLLPRSKPKPRPTNDLRVRTTPTLIHDRPSWIIDHLFSQQQKDTGAGGGCLMCLTGLCACCVLTGKSIFFLKYSKIDPFSCTRDDRMLLWTFFIIGKYHGISYFTYRYFSDVFSRSLEMELRLRNDLACCLFFFCFVLYYLTFFGCYLLHNLRHKWRFEWTCTSPIMGISSSSLVHFIIISFYLFCSGIMGFGKLEYHVWKLW